MTPWRVAKCRPPIAGESLNGYISRIAAAEFLPNSLVITSLGGVARAHRAELPLSCWEGLDAVADCLRVNVGELEVRSYPRTADGRRSFFGVPVDRMVLQSKRRRFAPTALAKDGHHRAMWDLRPFTFCDEHWEYLTDTCPHADCAAVQRWYQTPGIALCDQCGRSLTSSAGKPVEAELQGRLRLAAGLIHPQAERRSESVSFLAPALRSAGPEAQFGLLLACARLYDPRLNSRTKPVDELAAPADLALAMAESWSLLAGWPKSVEELAADRIAVRKGRFGDGNSGATVSFLDLDKHASSGARSAVASIRSTFEANVGTDKSVVTVARLAGLRVSEIAALRRAGELEASFGITGTKPWALIATAGAARLAAVNRQSLPIEEAAVRLGISYQGVEQLAALDLLKPVRDPAPKASRGPVRVSVPMLDQLERTLLNGDPAGPEEADWLDCRGALLFAGGQLKPWGPLLVAMLTGNVRYAISGGSEPLLRRVRIHPHDLARVAHLRFDRREYEFPFAPLMSKQDATDELNLGHRLAHAVLEEWPTEYGRGRTVPVAAIEMILLEAASLREIAAIHAISSRSASLLMEAQGVRRVSSAGFERTAALITRRSDGEDHHPEVHTSDR